MKYFWKWLGDKAEFIPGVPARDLTKEEIEIRGIGDVVERSPLFIKQSVKETKTENQGDK